MFKFVIISDTVSLLVLQVVFVKHCEKEWRLIICIFMIWISMGKENILEKLPLSENNYQLIFFICLFGHVNELKKHSSTELYLNFCIFPFQNKSLSEQNVEISLYLSWGIFKKS